MRVAIVGFPFSGKTTLFTAISGLARDHLKLSDETLAAVRIPEPRLDWLEQVYQPKKRTEATMEFVDLPGSLEGESDKAGLTRHLPALRQADVLLLVLRGFESAAVPLHKGRIDPAGDLQLLREEMLLADLVICDNRVEKLEKAIVKPSKERDQQKHELELLRRCRACLEAERPLAGVIQPGDEERMLRSFGFLTQKRYVAVVNVGEDRLGSPPPLADPGAFEVFSVCATLEAEIMQVDAADRPAFMAEYGIAALARDRIVRACFDALGMIFFLTAGEEEVRAWAIPKGATAVEAAGKIHTDLARGFIRAETVSYEDLRAAGSMREAKAHGKVRQEPKSYVVADGDVMLIKFNV
ncbi:MAG: YchF family ATPase [Phycisphaerae bacterium]|nr:redox-regulated ATPase YchF [Phycisphaerae bacterium]MCZ2398704.1 YchF family ATPase [Phycisphaerae bacterium]NUQ48944.1 redox-regulated ATPase YchF [Phycisphaerae bacterium]